MKQFLFSLLLGLVLCVGAQAQTENSQQPSRYFVQLQNGQVFYADRLKFKTPIFKQDYFLLNDSLRFNIEAVQVYQSPDGYFARIGYGNRSDSFAKRVLEGPRISKYYTTTFDYSNAGFSPYGYGMGAVPSRRRIYFFQKDNGPLMHFNVSNLNEALADNASSMLLLKRHKRDRLINTGMTIVGAGILALGVLNTANNSTEFGVSRVSPAVYAGAAVIALPFAIQLFQKDKLTQAVETYNYQLR